MVFQRIEEAQSLNVESHLVYFILCAFGPF